VYLKRLDMQGFKSFAQKISLDFGDGLTAIVGPNGSGKSNISDAIRWVMGEQSIKSLRGSKMEDVIFAGTEKQKALGFAEVSMTLDNTNGVFPIDYEEITVTRRVYRSGESEYFINKAVCRLRDIHELFMDTGLGKDGYSIIGQGRIAEIVGAKSTERREIFEEAAGISKIRYKKAEAERKLEAAQENIVRLKDIIGELESRVGPLRIQSEKAAEFIKLSEEKKRLEISIWMKKLDELRIALKELDDKILLNTAEYENIDADISKAEEKIQEIYKKMQESNARIEGFRQEILQTERAKGQLGSEIAVLENDIKHSGEIIEDIKKRQESARLSTKDTENEINHQLLKADEIEEQERLLREEMSAAEAELSALLDESGGFNREFEDASAALNKLYVKRSEYGFAISSVENSIKEINEQLLIGKENEDALALEAADLEKEFKELADGLAKIEDRLLEQENKLSGYSKLLEARLEKLSAARAEHSKIEFEIREKQQKIKLLSDLENSMEGFGHSVKEIVRAGKNAAISGIKGTVAQLIKVDDKYAAAIETALGGALQNVVVENEETAKRCIRFLKERNLGRATFLPVTSVNGTALSESGLGGQDGFVALAHELVEYDSRFSGIIKYLLGRIAVAEDLDSATLISKKYGYKFKVVTLDGQVINAGGSFTGGSVSRSAGVLTRKNEIAELEASVKELSAKLEQEKSKVLKLEAESEKLKFDIEGEKEKIDIIKGDKIRFEAEKKRIEAMTEQNCSRREETVSQILRLKERLSEQEKIFDGAKSELCVCNEEIKKLESFVEGAQDKKDALHQKREELSGKISELKIRIAGFEKDRQNILENIERLKASGREMENVSLELEAKLAEQMQAIDDKQALIAQKRTELEKSEEIILEFYEKIKSEQENHQKLEMETSHERAGLKEKNDVKEKFSREITKLEERKLSVQKDYDGMISEMWEQYNLTRSDASALAEEIDDMLAAQRDLNEVKSKIRSLGSVNLSAIEEYKEVFERYSFMSEQLKDVEVSKRELEKLIGNLTDEMKTRFSESFEKINQNFKEIFVELFGGGKAELVLEDPQNVLESGIEINVAPPGKVIKNLSLLSGGEQSFVAIAIYFAILKLRPSPFCILDEIEAALDDVNVSKFAAYLKNFVDTTQFIVITHRRGTMDEADVLYGVTMQEKGVSKLIKLDQNAVELKNA